MRKTLKQLKEEGKSPEMKVVKPHGQFYVPQNEKYHDWYYSAEQKSKRLRESQSGEKK